MVFRWFHLILISSTVVTFIIFTQRSGRIEVKNFKPFDQNWFLQSNNSNNTSDPSYQTLRPKLGSDTHISGGLIPLELNSAFFLPSRRQLLRFQRTISAKTDDDSVVDDQDFCPSPGPGRRQTAILIPIRQGQEPLDSEDSRSRTSFLTKSHLDNRADQSEIGFLPFKALNHDKSRTTSNPLMFRTNMTENKPCPVYYVPASPIFGNVPSLRPDSDTQFALRPILTTINKLKSLQVSFMRSLPFTTGFGLNHHTQQEFELWNRRGYPELMFGFATTPSRALSFIPRWSEWLPSSFPPVERQSDCGLQEPAISPLRRLTARAIVLIPPGKELDQAWEVESAARGAGLSIKLKELEAERFERRYMSLVQEMWAEALERERLGAPTTLWFTLADDDTYFLSMDSVARMLSKYDPYEPNFIGGQSESELARAAFGNIAFGGAGIFLSRGLMQQINAPGAFESCVSLFAKEFGGDGMITKCAAMMMRKDVQEVLTKEASLHQLDIRDEGHGIFQAGLRFTSIHHWNSWFQLQPRAHPHTLKDPSALASLLGSAARAVGPENWTRRYVWGLSEKGGKIKYFPDKPTVVLSLGYSITVHGSGLLKPKDLDKIEMTFAMNKLTSAVRPAFIETKQRRTYFLYDLKIGFSKPNDLNRYPDVAVMSHINQEGDVIDLVWDGRPRTNNKKT